MPWLELGTNCNQIRDLLARVAPFFENFHESSRQQSGRAQTFGWCAPSECVPSLSPATGTSSSPILSTSSDAYALPKWKQKGLLKWRVVINTMK